MIKLKLYKELIICVIYHIVLLGISLIFDRFHQMLIFILLFNVIQNCFKTRFHAESIYENNPIKAVKYCKIITISIEIIYLIFCKHLNITIYNNLFIIFCVALGNCLVEIACKQFIVSYNVFNNYENLKMLCEQANLSKQATERMMQRYIDKKSYEDIAENECVEVNSIKQSIQRSKNKIKELINN